MRICHPLCEHAQLDVTSRLGDLDPRCALFPYAYFTFLRYSHAILEIYNLGTNPFWNPYILLASPAIWLSWAVVMFCVIIVSFAWRTDTITAGPSEPLSPRSLLAARIMLTAFLIIGVLYFVLIVATLTQRIHKGKLGAESQPARGTSVDHSSTSALQRPARLQKPEKKRRDGE